MLVIALLVLFAIALGLLTVGVGLWMAFNLWHAVRRDAWRTVSGVVTDSRVVSNRRTLFATPGYHYRVRYEFTIGGQEYVASRVRFGDFRYMNVA